MSKNDGKIVWVLDGMRYAIDINDMTNREVHKACKIAEVGGLYTLGQNLTEGSTGAIVAVLSIAMERAGHKPDLDKLWDLNVGEITAGKPDPTKAGTDEKKTGTPSLPEPTESDPGKSKTSDRQK